MSRRCCVWPLFGVLLPVGAPALPPSAVIEAPGELPSQVLRALVTQMAAIDEQCVRVYDLNDHDRDPSPDIITEEPESCGARQDELLKVAARDPVAAAQLWWVLAARQQGLLTAATATLNGVVLLKTLPKACAAHECNTRGDQIAEELAKLAPPERQMHQLVFALQQFGAGKLPADPKITVSAQYTWLASELWTLAGQLGCVPADWQLPGPSVPDTSLTDAAHRCSPWWSSWYAAHRGKSAQWSEMAKSERLELLKSPDLALRVAAMDPPQGQELQFREAIVAAARPVWLDARTPRPVADAIARAANRADIPWTTLLNGAGLQPANFDWALVPLVGPVGPPEDPSTAVAPVPAALSSKQAKWVARTTKAVATFLQDCAFIQQMERDASDQEIAQCANRGKHLPAPTDPVATAYLWFALLGDSLDGVEEDYGHDSDMDSSSEAHEFQERMRQVADPTTLLLLLVKRLRAAGGHKDAGVPLAWLRQLTGVSMCAALPWDATQTQACAHRWADFAAAHRGETRAQWRRYGEKRALADAASLDLGRQYAACELLKTTHTDAAKLALAWTVRNAVLSSKVPANIGEAFVVLADQLRPLEVLYPALPGQPSPAPNLALPPK